MSWPTSVVIDAVFIPLYVLTLVLNLFNVFKHGRGKTVGFISLVLFSLLHLVGSILLVVEYKQSYSSISTTVWGYILQSIGISFLFSSALGLYTRSRASFETTEGQAKTAKLSKVLNLVNLAALICVIVGYNNTNFTNAQGLPLKSVHLPTEAKAGTLLYAAMMLTIAAMAVFGLKEARDNEAKLIKKTILAAVPFMLVRAAWSVYVVFQGSILEPKSIWAKLVLQYITEYVAMAIFTALGFVLEKIEKSGVESYDVEQIASSLSIGKEERLRSTPTMQFQQQLPMHNAYQQERVAPPAY